MSKTEKTILNAMPEHAFLHDRRITPAQKYAINEIVFNDHRSLTSWQARHDYGFRLDLRDMRRLLDDCKANNAGTKAIIALIRETSDILMAYTVEIIELLLSFDDHDERRHAAGTMNALETMMVPGFAATRSMAANRTAIMTVKQHDGIVNLGKTMLASREAFGMLDGADITTIGNGDSLVLGGEHEITRRQCTAFTDLTCMRFMEAVGFDKAFRAFDIIEQDMKARRRILAASRTNRRTLYALLADADEKAPDYDGVLNVLRALADSPDGFQMDGRLSVDAIIENADYPPEFIIENMRAAHGIERKLDDGMFASYASDCARHYSRLQHGLSTMLFRVEAVRGRRLDSCSEAFMKSTEGLLACMHDCIDGHVLDGYPVYDPMPDHYAPMYEEAGVFHYTQMLQPFSSFFCDERINRNNRLANYLKPVFADRDSAYRYGIWVSVRSVLWCLRYRKHPHANGVYIADICVHDALDADDRTRKTHDPIPRNTAMRPTETLLAWLHDGIIPDRIEECWSGINIPPAIREIWQSLPQSHDDYMRALQAGRTDITFNDALSERIVSGKGACRYCGGTIID